MMIARTICLGFVAVILTGVLLLMLPLSTNNGSCNDPIFYSIVKLKIPEVFYNKTPAELEIRNRYGLNIVAVGNAEKFLINPDLQERLHKDLAMVVIGSNRDIQRLPM